MQHTTLPLREVVAHLMRWNVARWQEPNNDLPGPFLEFRLRVPGLDAEIHDFLCAPPPPLDQSTAVEHLGQEWVPWLGAMISFQVLNSQIKWQATSTGDLQSVIEHSDTDRSASDRVVTVTECIHQRLAKSKWREKWFILSFHHARRKTAANREVPIQKQRSFFQQAKSIPGKLSLIKKVVLGNPTEASHPNPTLRIIWHHALRKGYDSSLYDRVPLDQVKLLQRLRWAGQRRIKPSRIDRFSNGPTNLVDIKIVKHKTLSDLVLPSPL
jgi:hypothetical protein